MVPVGLHRGSLSDLLPFLIMGQIVRHLFFELLKGSIRDHFFIYLEEIGQLGAKFGDLESSAAGDLKGSTINPKNF